MAICSTYYKDIREARAQVQEQNISRLYVFEDGTVILPSTLRMATFKPLGKAVHGSNTEHICRIFKEKSEQIVQHFTAMKGFEGQIESLESQNRAIKAQIQAIGAEPDIANHTVLRENVQELEQLRSQFEEMKPEFTALELDLRFIAKMIKARRSSFEKTAPADIKKIYAEFLQVCAQVDSQVTTELGPL